MRASFPTAFLGFILTVPAIADWSIATSWRDGWPADWHQISPLRTESIDEWTIHYGELVLPSGKWLLQDATRPFPTEPQVTEIRRRWHWTGNITADHITLSFRYPLGPLEDARPFLPAISYYDNPAGQSVDPTRIPVISNASPLRRGFYEEHRFSLPFAAIEALVSGSRQTFALHTVPSPAAQGNLPDQWWSLGVEYTASGVELAAYSGPVASNGQNAIIKGHQRSWHPYDDAWLTVPPDTIIEKTFFVQSAATPVRGHGFRPPLWTSIRLSNPFNPDGFPPFRDVIARKLADTENRWREGPNFAGIKSFPTDHRATRNWIDLAWAGQSEAFAYPYLALAAHFPITAPIDRIQRGIDFITTSNFTDAGFSVRYDFDLGQWLDNRRPVLSQAQAMNNLLDALRLASTHHDLDTSKWTAFLTRACDFHATRVLADDWHPVSTNEGFLIAPLAKASRQLHNPLYLAAARKAADHYLARHLSMDEPYWGGTLDARCEDKEGAWAALQGFLALHEITGDAHYLEAALHAGDVVLSYVYTWDVPLPAGRLTDHAFKTRGWTSVSTQNMHLDVYGVLCAPAIWRLGDLTGNDDYHRLARLMLVACGQLLDPHGSQGEQIHQTNYAQHYDYTDLAGVRGDYVESWNVYWISAHFLVAAAQFEEMGVDWIDW